MADTDKQSSAAPAAQKQSTIPGPAPGTPSNAANAQANADAAQQAPGGQPKPAQPAENPPPTDPTPELSVGGNNPNQPPIAPAGVTGRHPHESVGYSPRPADDTGAADTTGPEYQQAVQRLAPTDSRHPIAEGMNAIVNIPPGSRPSMVDPSTGFGVVPPQMGQKAKDEAEAGKDPITA